MGRTSNAKDRLLGAALEAIWAQSFSGVSVDDICKKAEVKKGSFYHYFDSKEDLALQAIDFSWENFRPKMDGYFSPENKPLDRLRLFLEHVIEFQTSFLEQGGAVMGCPYSTIGSEQSCMDSDIREKAASYLDKIRTYTGSAIKEAYDGGEVCTSIDADKLIAIYNNYYVGVMTQARVKNDISVLENIVSEFMYILGAEDS